MRQPGVAFVDKRMALLSPCVKEYADVTLTKDVLSVFCGKVANACQKAPLKQEQRWALGNSVSDMEGRRLTSAQIKANINRLVANWNFIQEGLEIPYWDGTVARTDAVFIGFKRFREVVNGIVWHMVRVKLKTGLPAGIIYGVRLSRRQIEVFLDRVSGTGRYHCGVEELAGMTANVAVERQGEFLHILDWECSADQKKANLEITEARSDARKCPTRIPCSVCRSTIADCSLAVWLKDEET